MRSDYLPIKWIVSDDNLSLEIDFTLIEPVCKKSSIAATTVNEGDSYARKKYFFR